MWSLRLFPATLLVTLVCGAPPPGTTQLADEDIGTFAPLSFGDPSAPHNPPSCRAFPGTADWPTRCEWQRLNKTISGHLLHPNPPAAVCYDGESHDEDACQDLLLSAGDTHFYIDDPLSVLSQWTQGSTCLPALNPEGECERGGFPEYVVNVTEVTHVQAGVNFARNKNLRLVIKWVSPPFPHHADAGDMN